MVGVRNLTEQQLAACQAMEKCSQKLTEAGVSNFVIVANPLEGTNVSGSSALTTKCYDSLVASGLDDWIREDHLNGEERKNHSSTRRRKVDLLRKIYKTNLNPLPVKFEDLQKTEIIKIVFVKMMNIEVLMIKFKWGNSLPSILREWYPEEHEDIFPHLKGHNGSEK